MAESYFIINRVKRDGEAEILYEGNLLPRDKLVEKLQRLEKEHPTSGGALYHIFVAEIDCQKQNGRFPSCVLEHCGIEKVPQVWNFKPGWEIWHNSERQPVKRAIDLILKKFSDSLI